MKTFVYCTIAFCIGFAAMSSLWASATRSHEEPELDIGTIPDRPVAKQPQFIRVTLRWLPAGSHRCSLHDPFGFVNVVIEVCGTLQLPPFTQAKPISNQPLTSADSDLVGYIIRSPAKVTRVMFEFSGVFNFFTMDLKILNPNSVPLACAQPFRSGHFYYAIFFTWLQGRTLDGHDILDP